MLILNKTDTINLVYRRDHRILYNGPTWRIFMVDSTSVALVFLTKYVELPGKGETWTIKNTKGHKLSVRLDYLGHFDLYGESTISLSGESLLDFCGRESIYFEGDGDLQVYRNATFNTPHYLAHIVWPPDGDRLDGCLSIIDVKNHDTDCIVAKSANIHYSRKEASAAGTISENFKRYLSARFSKFTRSALTMYLLPAGKLTASQLLEKIRDWYGLDSYFVEQTIDTTAIGGLYAGTLALGSLDTLLNILECSVIHYTIIDNKICVWAEPAHTKLLHKHLKFKSPCD